MTSSALQGTDGAGGRTRPRQGAHAPDGSDTQSFETRKQYSVLTMNTLAFTVNFAIWTMFSVIGIRIKSELGLNETEFGLLVATPILTGSLIRLPLGHSDRPLWWPRRLFHSNDPGGDPDLRFGVRHPILAVPHHRSFRRSGRRLVCHRNRLHLRLVSEREAGHRHGHLRRRQCRRCGYEPCGAIDHRRLRLARGAAGLFRRHVGDGGAILVLHLSRSEA